jgi:hypothetical protein
MFAILSDPERIGVSLPHQMRLICQFETLSFDRLERGNLSILESHQYGYEINSHEKHDAG